MDTVSENTFSLVSIVNGKAMRKKRGRYTTDTLQANLDCRPIDGLSMKRIGLISIKNGPIKPGPKLLLQKMIEKKLPQNACASGIDEEASVSMPNTSTNRKFLLNLSSESLRKESCAEKISSAPKGQKIVSDKTLDQTAKRSFIRGITPLNMQTPAAKQRKERLKQVMTMKPQECSILGHMPSPGVPRQNEVLMDEFVKFKCGQTPRAASRQGLSHRVTRPRQAFSVSMLKY